MEIIPVIDLMESKVVRAMKGNRSQYAPIQSSLCVGSEALMIVEALLELYPFDKLYIADLDSILKRGDNFELIQSIQVRYPTLALWVDAGIETINHLKTIPLSNITWVIGSEKISTLNQWLTIIDGIDPNSIVLSLDFDSQGLIGQSNLDQHPETWTNQVIAMTLKRVGSYDGPDMQTLRHLQKRNPKTQVYAAGGIRNIDDALSLEKQGVTGALIASSLHDGRISNEDIKKLSPS